MINLAFEASSSTLQNNLLHTILRRGANGSSSPLEEGVLPICIALKNPNLGFNGKHTNHYTTKVTIITALIMSEWWRKQWNELQENLEELKEFYCGADLSTIIPEILPTHGTFWRSILHSTEIAHYMSHNIASIW
jgi:hypothetical protein